MELISGLIAALVGFVIALSGAARTASVGVESYAAPARHAVTTSSAHIIFGGDMMFDRTIRTTIEQKGGDYVFSCLDPLFSSADLVVANLEGPITASSSRSVGSAVGSPDNFVFTFPTTTAQLLARHNVRMVNLGNNHIFNFGLSGVTSTEMYLDTAGVGHFGDPDKIEEDRVARIDVGGTPVSFVNWSDWTSDKTDHTVAQVRTEAQAGRMVFVYTHWGIEYATTSPERVHTLAHQFIDAGAQMVIGSHPHVVAEHEVYKGKHIYYSLGNLIFDQYWMDGVRHGLLVEATIGADGSVRAESIPVVLSRDRRTCPVE